MLKAIAAAWVVLALLVGGVLAGVGAAAAGSASAAATLLEQQETRVGYVGSQLACANDGTGAVLYANAARAAGFPEEDVDGDGLGELLTAVAVGGGESTWNPQAGNRLADGRTHRGPMQISSLHLDDPTINVEGGDRRTDPAVNYRMAYRLWVANDRQWSPTWSAYTDGGYKRHLIEAQAAVEGTTVNQCAVAAVAAGKTGGSAGNLNGRLDESQLCPLRFHPGQRLRCDVADDFDRLVVAYAEQFRTLLCVTDSYRDYASQVAVRAARPTLAAVPGTSNHGWAIAVDLCGGIERFGTPQHRWMQANAPRFGWMQPTWATIVGSKPEPWHWQPVGVQN